MTSTIRPRNQRKYGNKPRRIGHTLVVFGLGTPMMSMMALGQDICFDRIDSYPAGLNEGKLAVGDLNDDNHPDVIVASRSGLSVLLNDGAGAFPSFQSLSTDRFNEATIANVNGDRFPDIVAVRGFGNDDIVTFLNQGDGTFQLGTSTSLPWEAGTIDAVDFNGDLLDDVVVGQAYGSECKVMMNNGAGGFDNTQTIDVGTEIGDLELSDIDLDTDPDIVGSANYEGKIFVLENSGNGHFGSVINYPGSKGRSIAIGLINGDEYPDIVVASRDRAGFVTVSMNQGDGSFGIGRSYFARSYAQDVSIGDVDGDSDNDIVVTPYYYGGTGFTILTNDGTGAFTDLPINLATGELHNDNAVTDLDGDNDLDIVTSGFYETQISVLTNICGRISFSVDATCPSGGSISVGWQGATPGGRVAIVMSPDMGSFTIPAGHPCPGTSLDLSSAGLRVVFTGSAGANGENMLQSNAPQGFCGQYLQLLDLDRCIKSNVAQIR